MTRILAVLVLALAFSFASTASASADSGISITTDASTCGQLTVTASGLQANTDYQLVGDIWFRSGVTHTVTANGLGVATTTFQRSEFNPDSSALWGAAAIRTKYGDYMSFNDHTEALPVPHTVVAFATYHLCQ